MRRRWWAWVAVGATVLGACGGDDGSADGGTGAPTTAASTERPTATTAPTRSTTTPAPATATAPTAPPATAAPDGVVPEGFEQVPATVTLADGTVCELCLWLADTADRRRRGLMGVTDLDGADGMAFVYDTEATSQFWMRGTPMPLSIAFFAADGAFVSTQDMTPCLEGPDADCARYGADGPYTTAIELPLGDVARLGIGPGSVLALGAGAGCTGTT